MDIWGRFPQAWHRYSLAHLTLYWKIAEKNKKHLKNVGPIRYCEPPLHCQSPGVASRTPVHDNNNDNAWQRGPLWTHGMGPITPVRVFVRLFSQSSVTSVAYNETTQNTTDFVAVGPSPTPHPVVESTGQLGVIVGLSLTALVFVAVILIIIVFIVCRRRWA